MKIEASLSSITYRKLNRSFRLDFVAVVLRRTGSWNSVLATRYFFFPLTFAPIRNNFRTVPVGSRFI
jgi:hypothetical protein